ncbi:MAG: adenylate/guanylate cyclase domain-containing protein [Acidimicrobiia bacterium]|nr:adenylate/guanylate cyclase domain-containing protein [Acidimicrobiia bacterium]
MRDPAADLLGNGASPQEVDDAKRDGTLHLLALDYTLFPGAHYLTLTEAAERAGLGSEVAVRVARALGLVASVDDRVYGDHDVKVLERMAEWLGSGVDLDVALAMYRVMGSAMARIAESEVGFVAAALTEAFARGTPTPEDSALLASMLPVLAAERLPEITRVLDYVHRRALLSAAQREILWQVGTRTGVTESAVGFCDLVGFTAYSRHVDPDELAGLVDRFETRTHEIVTAGGGRVVKMIGDAVLFTSTDTSAAVAIALDITAEFGAAGSTSDVRAGVARGELLSRDGDVFGAVVNLASRITSRALPGTVLVDDSVHDELARSETLTWRELRPRKLKGIGTVRLWRVLRR